MTAWFRASACFFAVFGLSCTRPTVAGRTIDPGPAPAASAETPIDAKAETTKPDCPETLVRLASLDKARELVERRTALWYAVA